MKAQITNESGQFIGTFDNKIDKKSIASQKRTLTREIKELQNYFDIINSLYVSQGKPLYFWYFGERKHSRIVYETKKEIEALQAKREQLDVL